MIPLTSFRIALIGGLSCLGVYLFVTAPPPLAEAAAQNTAQCERPVQVLFDSANAINQAARNVYTREIVGAGMKAGLKFDEDWQEPDVEAGPLPALFLRLMAEKLEAMPPQLGLYLGSDAPINASNLFSGAQATQFAEVKARRAPVFSGDTEVGQIAMYPDIAAVAPCVTCHNEHPDSPKVDWALGDVMGATTWTWPAASVGSDAYLSVLEAMFKAVALAYQDYLSKTAGFAEPVPLGDWPKQVRSLPQVDDFIGKVRQESGPELLRVMLPMQQGQFESGDLKCALS